MRIQTRGGGDGGWVERELAVSVPKVAVCAGDKGVAIPAGAGVTAKTLAHFSAQPKEPIQPPFPCLSQ
jgi:hypothetical protein